jgi:hypothetical protein
MAMDDNSTDSRNRDLHVEDPYLKAFDVDGSVDRFLALPVRGMRLVIAAAAFTRLQSVFELTRNANWDDYDGDQWDRAFDAVEDYGILREVLLTTLEREPAFRLAYDLVHRAFPMTDSAFASAFELVTLKDPIFDPNSAKASELKRRWTLDLTSETLVLEHELRRLGAQEGLDPFAPDINAFLLADDELAEDEIGPILGNVFDAARDTWQRQMAAMQPAERPSPISSATTRPSGRRSGRHPASITYGIAAHTWWEMRDEYEDFGERRRPTQAELSQRLSAQGYAVGARTLRRYIMKWRAAELLWPPPRSN